MTLFSSVVNTLSWDMDYRSIVASQATPRAAGYNRAESLRIHDKDLSVYISFNDTQYHLALCLETRIEYYSQDMKEPIRAAGPFKVVGVTEGEIVRHIKKEIITVIC